MTARDARGSIGRSSRTRFTPKSKGAAGAEDQSRVHRLRRHRAPPLRRARRASRTSRWSRWRTRIPSAPRRLRRATGARALSPATTRCWRETELDALWICVPPFAHGAPERAAIARGLPFFVEKPVSLDAELALEIDEAVRRAGLVTAVGYHWRYLDTVDEARRLLRDNPAHLMSGYWIDQTPPPDVVAARGPLRRADGRAGDARDRPRALPRRRRGRGLRHGRPARPRPISRDLDVATASTATLRFASGAIATLSATCLLRWGHRIGLHVFADALAIELTDHDIMVDVGRGRPTRRRRGRSGLARGPRLRRCGAAAARTGYGRPMPRRSQTHRVALAVARSARTGAPVRMEGLRADPQPIFRPAAAADARVA